MLYIDLNIALLTLQTRISIVYPLGFRISSTILLYTVSLSSIDRNDSNFIVLARLGLGSEVSVLTQLGMNISWNSKIIFGQFAAKTVNISDSLQKRFSSSKLKQSSS